MASHICFTTASWNYISHVFFDGPWVTEWKEERKNKTKTKSKMKEKKKEKVERKD